MLLVSEAGGLPWYVRTKVSLTALEADCEMKVSGTGQCLPGLPFSVSHLLSFPSMAIPLLMCVLLTLSGTSYMGKAHPTDIDYSNPMFKGSVSQNSHMHSYGLSIRMERSTIPP